MKDHFEFIKYLIGKQGPDPQDYSALDSWIIETSDYIRDKKISEVEIKDLIQLFGDAFSAETMQGFAFQKPHGYAGDFEIIHRIYKKYVSQKPNLMKWDLYWQNHAAAEAVRNRVYYFSDQIKKVVDSHHSSMVNVLNLASGPGNDMSHFFNSNPDIVDKVYIDCIEQDNKAIEFARQTCKEYVSRINFMQKNALRFSNDKHYDLIWSAGLFDYFDDKLFVFLLEKLKPMLNPKGTIIIGNFCSTNPSRDYMRLFEWHLHHRSPHTLKKLAMRAGFSVSQIFVDKEASGVNLFLHMQAD